MDIFWNNKFLCLEIKNRHKQSRQNCVNDNKFLGVLKDRIVHEKFAKVTWHILAQPLTSSGVLIKVIILKVKLWAVMLQ